MILFLFLVYVVVPVLGILGILDAALTPDSVWHRADQNKIAWVIVQFIPLIGAIAYFRSVRPGLRAAARDFDLV